MLSDAELRLVSCLALLYLAAYINRTNISNAKIEGLNEDFGLNSVQYNILRCIFFVPSILLAVQAMPSSSGLSDLQHILMESRKLASFLVSIEHVLVSTRSDI